MPAAVRRQAHVWLEQHLRVDPSVGKQAAVTKQPTKAEQKKAIKAPKVLTLEQQDYVNYNPLPGSVLKGD